MSADMPRDMQSSTWRLAVGGCLLGSAIACAPMSKTPATPTAVSTRFINSHPNRRRAPSTCRLYFIRELCRVPGGLQEGHTGTERQRCPTTSTAAAAKRMSSGECVAKQLEQTFPMPLRRGLVVHGPLRKGEPMLRPGIYFHFGVSALLVEFRAQLVDHFLRRV